MTTLKIVADAWIASVHQPSGSLGRIRYWVEQFGDVAIDSISEDDVDIAIGRLIKRGKLQGGIGIYSSSPPTGEPLKGSTVNRYVSTLASLFKYAKHLKLLPRSYIPPTKGVVKEPEPVDPDKYFRTDEVEKLVKVSKALDNRWGKLAALIILGFHTGLRISSLKKICWGDIDWDGGTFSVAVTKNGRPHVAVLTPDCLRELTRIKCGSSDELVFKSYRCAKAFDHRKLWKKVCDEAGFEGRTFHWLRHGCGTALASAGISQAQMMSVMGHRTLVASARYIHSNVEERRIVVSQVFS